MRNEQLEFIKRLCLVLPNPPMDLVVVGNPTLLVEVKTTTMADKSVAEIKRAYTLYFEKARSFNLFPTLAVVRAAMENGGALLSVERYAMH